MVTRKNKTKKPNLAYTIGPGHHVRKDQAEALFSVIVDVFGGNKPTPDQLIKEARKKSSPAHILFDWNVKTAAAAHYRTEAQRYLRAVHVYEVEVEVSKATRAKSVRAWWPTIRQGHTLPESGYVKTETALKDEAVAAEIMNQAYKELESWCRRYKRYGEFLGVFGEVVDAFAKITPTKIMARRPT
jgi:hypothetical protein